MLNVKTIAQISKLFIILTFIFTLLVPSVHAASPLPTCNPASPDPEVCPAGLTQIENTFSNFVSISVGLAFVALLVMAIFAGFKYLISAGEPKAVSAAHQTLMWALLGIFFMAIAWIILLLIKEFTGVDVFIFDVKSLCNVPGVGDVCK